MKQINLYSTVDILFFVCYNGFYYKLLRLHIPIISNMLSLSMVKYFTIYLVKNYCLYFLRLFFDLFLPILPRLELFLLFFLFLLFLILLKKSLPSIIFSLSNELSNSSDGIKSINNSWGVYVMRFYIFWFYYIEYFF